MHGGFGDYFLGLIVLLLDDTDRLLLIICPDIHKTDTCCKITHLYASLVSSGLYGFFNAHNHLAGSIYNVDE
jgi:hypothetical protein